MKQFWKIAAVLLLALAFGREASCAVNEAPLIQTRLNYADMKCLWISQYDLRQVYCDRLKQRSQEQFTRYIDKILNNTVAMGFNTVIVQMRPNADSMYPSEYYPPSMYVVGAYGNEFSYDPIQIIVDLAHKKGLSVHAWINPMRAMSIEHITKISSKYPIRQWYNNINTKGKYVVQKGSYYYLNPAYEEVRQLIINGITEIFSKYNVDGIHMDDYFYPTTDVNFDADAYRKYKEQGGGKSLADFRRNNLSTLVKGIYNAVKSADINIMFGISPTGNWQVVYNNQYADIYLWCSKAGYIDYICPQIYFGLKHQTYSFTKAAEQWHKMIRDGSNVKLIVGMSLGKALSKVDNYAGTGKYEWKENNNILQHCLEYTKTLPKCSGVAYFCYQYFYNPLTGISVAKTEAERKNMLPVLKEISWQK